MNNSHFAIALSSPTYVNWHFFDLFGGGASHGELVACVFANLCHQWSFVLRGNSKF